MKLFANKKLFKKIVILLVVITLVNALIPLHMVSADADKDFGGPLFRPMCRFFAGIGDLLIRGLQDIFIGSGDINIRSSENSGIYFSNGNEIPIPIIKYQIRYSPGVIFSNKVPGLDANFISPGDPILVKQMQPQSLYENLRILDPTGQTWLEDKGFTLTETDVRNKNVKDLYFISNTSGSTLALINKDWAFVHELSSNDVTELMADYGNSIELKVKETTLGNSLDQTMKVDGDYLLTVLKNRDFTLYSLDGSSGEVKKSVAAQLQKTVSKWYKALRMVSLVTLLSVLVYVGIRIIISSTGQEKAKYKKMIGDWVVAICILFVLNYIMAFTMDIVNKIIEIFSYSNLVDTNGVDILISEIRDKISSDAYSSLTTFTNLVLYLVLVVYTIIFTVHYLKRVVYLAFFTMIAPLIAVTYPIDRIKDGQAQAFGTWIKEYTFNAAIPVIHIIIYSALVGSASDLARSNPLYAIVCIFFLIPAEKFFKKLFGFEKATTVGQLGAAAGGALIMNAINKMGAKSGKQAAAKAGASSSSASRGLSANAMQIASGTGGAGEAGGETVHNGGRAAWRRRIYSRRSRGLWLRWHWRNRRLWLRWCWRSNRRNGN